MTTPENLKYFDGSVEELILEINLHEGLTVVKFGSSTCMPCRRIKQLLPGFATNNPTVLFIDYEVDKHQDAAEKFNISSVPDTKFFKGKDEQGNPVIVDSVIGAQVPQIKAKIEQYK